MKVEFVDLLMVGRGNEGEKLHTLFCPNYTCVCVCGVNEIVFSSAASLCLVCTQLSQCEEESDADIVRTQETLNTSHVLQKTITMV